MPCLRVWILPFTLWNQLTFLISGNEEMGSAFCGVGCVGSMEREASLGLGVVGGHQVLSETRQPTQVGLGCLLLLEPIKQRKS